MSRTPWYQEMCFPAFIEDVWPLLKDKSIGGWTADMEKHSGSVFWTNGEQAIYASPFWEGSDGIVFETCDGDGVASSSDPYEYELTGDAETDADNYIAVVTKYIESLKDKKEEVTA